MLYWIDLDHRKHSSKCENHKKYNSESFYQTLANIFLIRYKRVDIRMKYPHTNSSNRQNFKATQLLNEKNFKIFIQFTLFLILLFFTTSCESSLKTIDSSNYLLNPTTLAFLFGSNIMDISINGTNCGPVYDSSNQILTPNLNSLCASVTICDSNSSHCQTIPGLRIDTVHAGLRIFKSAINNSTLNALTPVIQGTSPNELNLATFQVLQESYVLWGSIYEANITLGGETTPTPTTLQIIDNGTLSTGSDQSSASSALLTTLNNTTNPASNFTLITAPTGTYAANGILGIGPEQYYCNCYAGSNCINANNNQYFACSTTTYACNSTATPLNQQLKNPITALSQNNNGAILSLPSVPAGGSSSKNGYLILGIDTQSNNASTGMTVFPCTNDRSEFKTTLQGNTFQYSLFQTLSNYNYIGSNLSIASSSSPQYYTPSSVQTLRGSILGTTNYLDFQLYIGNSLTINNYYQTSRALCVFSEFAAYNNNNSGYNTLYGLPFFLGRNVFIGFESASSNLGSGRYYAF
jgi:hypothetical protein